MRRSQRLLRIAELSRKAERAAAQTQATSQRQLDQYQRQLNDLQKYREEYRTRLRSGSSTPMNASEAQKLSAFIAQVDSVIEGLQTKIAQVTHAHNHDRDAWAQQRNRVNTLDGIARRVRTEEQNTEEARDQRGIDDRVPMKSQV